MRCPVLVGAALGLLPAIAIFASFVSVEWDQYREDRMPHTRTITLAELRTEFGIPDDAVVTISRDEENIDEMTTIKLDDGDFIHATWTARKDDR